MEEFSVLLQLDFSGPRSNQSLIDIAIHIGKAEVDELYYLNASRQITSNGKWKSI